MSEKDFIPYEASHRIRPLLFVVTIVNQGQGEAIAQLCLSNEARNSNFKRCEFIYWNCFSISFYFNWCNF